MRGSPEEFAALASCVALELATGRPSHHAEEKLVELHMLLSWAAGETSDLSRTALAAEVLLRDESRRRRDARRGPKRHVRRAAEAALLVHVRLLDVQPAVWRRLELPSHLTLADLHPVLVLAQGWTDAHLHVFRQGDRSFAPIGSLDDILTEDSRSVLLGELLARPDDRLEWEYDFGDSWRHELRLESLQTAPADRPRLVAGEGACPPEDSGGPGGYSTLLAALADPSHPEHEHYREWLDEPFDPAAFDLERHDRWLERLAKVWEEEERRVPQPV